ncbi:MAG TPA: hypothetical protein VMV29_13365 [Ktedonobacterales bacterium]|nr:hypothetical protein [Ktedonobacterales bacterium]
MATQAGTPDGQVDVVERVRVMARRVARHARCEVAFADDAVLLREWRAAYAPDQVWGGVDATDLAAVGMLRPWGQLLVVGWSLGFLAGRYSPQAIARDLCTPAVTVERPQGGPLTSRMARVGEPITPPTPANTSAKSVLPLGIALPRQLRISRVALAHAGAHPTVGLTATDEATQLTLAIETVGAALADYGDVPVAFAVLRSARGRLRIETHGVNGATERLRAALRMTALVEAERGGLITLGQGR